ncbi:hypothetical protein SCUP515_10101 [Seiridium cupressi]
MLALTLSASLLLTSTLAIPLQSRQTQVFQITALSARFPTDGTTGTGPIDSEISITLTYPDPSSTDANLTTTCSYAWPASPGPGPTNWTTCADSRVQWRLPEKGWTSDTNFRVQVFETLTDDGAGLEGSHYLDFNPGGTNDDSAYLSCIQMGKFNPLTCTLGGTLAPHQPPVILTATPLAAIPE